MLNVALEQTSLLHVSKDRLQVAAAYTHGPVSPNEWLGEKDFTNLENDEETEHVKIKRWKVFVFVGVGLQVSPSPAVSSAIFFVPGLLLLIPGVVSLQQDDCPEHFISHMNFITYLDDSIMTNSEKQEKWMDSVKSPSHEYCGRQAFMSGKGMGTIHF
ncbi:unnamed protein product [Ranitomeya imitator]|uniref:Uncharacterized protein n=1 Tax=Ranitomeya imitator TaxID=111125 RepID=A0ABN9L5N0_9NEOB|nr:unnamed protein product [Ranitomeya imitator]